MSIGADLQTLSSGDSPYIELFEIQVNDTDFIYITSYLKGLGDFEEESGTNASSVVLQFRDYDDPTNTIREYFPIPAQFDGIEHKSEGQFPQPSFTIANILRTTSGNDSLQALLGTISYEDLLGYKVIRRRTLEKYLYGQSGDSNPPIELPRDIYYLDRIEDENSQAVTFTTVLPIDFTGVMIPKRNIIGNICPWKYQGAGEDLNEWDKTGGCIWRRDSRIQVAGNNIYVYVNEDDEYIVDSDTSFPTYTSSATQGSFYKTAVSELTKIGPTGSLTSVTSGIYNYWQSLTGENIAPSDNSPNWRRVRIFTDFSGNPAVNVYTNDKYNDYFRNSNIVWKAIGKSQTSAGAPAAGNLWERGDRCGKRISSCKARFQVNPVITLTVDDASNLKQGETIMGETNDSKAHILEITGNVLSLTNITGEFDDNEYLSINSPSWIASTVYAIGDRVLNGTKIYECTVAGEAASSGGPTHSSGTATDNEVTWQFISVNITSARVDGTLSITPATNTIATEHNVLPFGSFPTARVFQ